jgi:amyloid beta precursor protein binding protein 1
VALIKSLNKHGVKSLNFVEAVQNATECYKTNALPSNIANLFSKINENQTSTFWLCAAAMKLFFEAEGRLPVAGVLPDMVSTTDFYLKLQHIYITKAESDAAKMK